MKVVAAGRPRGCRLVQKGTKRSTHGCGLYIRFKASIDDPWLLNQSSNRDGGLDVAPFLYCVTTVPPFHDQSVFEIQDVERFNVEVSFRCRDAQMFTGVCTCPSDAGGDFAAVTEGVTHGRG